MNRAAWLVLAVCWAGLSTGCVTRRVLITSEPPGAIVYRNGVYLGPTPVEEQFVYYGQYNYRLVRDGYEPLDVSPELETPWYEYPGIDFISENLTPFLFRDVKHLHFALNREKPVRPDDIRSRADTLRQEAATIPGSPRPPRQGRTSRSLDTPAKPDMPVKSDAPAKMETPQVLPMPTEGQTPRTPPVNGPTGPVARSPELP